MFPPIHQQQQPQQQHQQHSVSAATTTGPQYSYIDSLNQMVDPVSFLTDLDLQEELDLFANAQFTFDVEPGVIVADKPSADKGDNACFDFSCSLTDKGVHHHHHYQEEQHHQGYVPAGTASIVSEPSTPLSQTFSPQDSTTPIESAGGAAFNTPNLAPAATRRRATSSTKSENCVKQKLSKDDKRQRNTEASARFRIKKKLREQALQRTAYEMTEKAKFLENRVQELEKEIKWLRALVVEKNEVRIEQLLREKPAVTTAPVPSFMTATTTTTAGSVDEKGTRNNN